MKRRKSSQEPSPEATADNQVLAKAGYRPVREPDPLESIATTLDRRERSRLTHCQPCGGGYRIIRKAIRNNY